MLNRAKILTALQNRINVVVNTWSEEKRVAQEIWQKIKDEHELSFKIEQSRSEFPFLLPSWHGQLGSFFSVPLQSLPYRVLAADGSQIYPDHHQGIICSVINIGSADFYYNNPSKVTFETVPFVFFKGEKHDMDFEENFINAKRTELEWCTGLEGMARNVIAQGPHLFLCDGSLIFWHLDSYPLAIKQRFLTSYITLLQQFYERNHMLAGYISLSQSKELLNIVRFAAQKGVVPACKYLIFDHLVDADILEGFLRPGERTIIFKNHAPIVATYPESIKPYFFYLHAGHEIVRLEIPAWLAQDDQKVTLVSSIVYDQILKGHGYPVCLSEAHEQAVIKEADRQFFYHMIEKLTNSSCSPSIKSMKKRRMTI
jgi:hypothetical protein